MASNKPRNVPNAVDVDKDELDVNPMGHPEKIVKKPGKPIKRVLNELEPPIRECFGQKLSRVLGLIDNSFAGVRHATH